MKVGIVGCGLTGNKRAKALGEDRLLAVADVHADRARQSRAESGDDDGGNCSSLGARLTLNRRRRPPKRRQAKEDYVSSC